MNSCISKSVPVLAVYFTLLPATSIHAEPFVQGSAINIAAGQSLTLDMPADGVFNCSSITIGCNASLRFTPNSLNAPVFLLSGGDVTIQGRIHVDGADGAGTLGGTGGPGGFPGGMGGIAGGHTQGGDGAGPGGGKNVGGWFAGVFAYPQNVNSNVYGNALLFPLIGGSGGAGRDAAIGNYGGGGGGGAILIYSPTQVAFSRPCNGPNDGGIYARGGGAAFTRSGGGSGGAIRLVAPLVRGDGFLDTTGGFGVYVSGNGNNPSSYSDNGSQGRVRIDCLDDYAYRSLTILGSFTRGSQMNIFPPVVARLDIIEAAGMSIPSGITNAVTVLLPFGSPTNHTVTLRAGNFTNDVPVRIAVTPDTGPSLTFDGVIASTENPATKVFDIVIPEGTVSRIDAWTR